MSVNNQLVLVVGKSSSGKSASLRNLKNHEGVAYLGCESGKNLPFPNDFRKMTVTDPLQVYSAFEQSEAHDEVHTIVIDSMTFLMDMYETVKVLPATDGRAAWGEYAQYWKKLMQKYVASTTKNVIMTAHTMDILNESEGVMETLVKVKGSLMNQGIEAYFCNVVACKRMPVTKLKDYENPHLIISDEEEMLGFKYVYQTKLTKETIHERIRGPLGMWDVKETFINNDAQFLLDQLTAYYK